MNKHASELGKLGGRKGGLSRSERKVAAVRANGRKGGYWTHKRHSTVLQSEADTISDSFT